MNEDEDFIELSVNLREYSYISEYGKLLRRPKTQTEDILVVFEGNRMRLSEVGKILKKREDTPEVSEKRIITL